MNVASSRRRELKLLPGTNYLANHAVASSRRRELKPFNHMVTYNARSRLLTEA